MFSGIPRLLFRWRGVKVYSQTGGDYGRISLPGYATVRGNPRNEFIPVITDKNALNIPKIYGNPDI